MHCCLIIVAVLTCSSVNCNDLAALNQCSSPMGSNDSALQVERKGMNQTSVGTYDLVLKIHEPHCIHVSLFSVCVLGHTDAQQQQEH